MGNSQEAGPTLLHEAGRHRRVCERLTTCRAARELTPQQCTKVLQAFGEAGMHYRKVAAETDALAKLDEEFQDIF